jgi:hypothetical protein
MGLREELQKRIAKKEAEIREYQDKIREAGFFVQGLQDAMKLVPKGPEDAAQEAALRSSGSAAKARDALRAAGRPLHINELLKAMGQPTDKKHRLTLASSLAAYVRKAQIFTRPEPNTFGLSAFKEVSDEEPEDFAVVSDEEAEEIQF